MSSLLTGLGKLGRRELGLRNDGNLVGFGLNADDQHRQRRQPALPAQLIEVRVVVSDPKALGTVVGDPLPGVGPQERRQFVGERLERRLLE